MVIIKFPDGADWYKANWVFRQFANDILAVSSDDAELQFAFKEASAIGALFLDRMEVALQGRAIRVMKEVAQQTLSGKIAGWKAAQSSEKSPEQMYSSSIAELLEMLEARAS